MLRRLRSIGLHLEYSAGANHWRVMDPGTGAYLTSVSGTPSDGNFWKQIKRAVEKAGFNWQGRKRRRIKRPNTGEVSAIDLEALAHAQRMARLHGQREPRLEDLEDKNFLSRLRQGFNEQETEEAISHMAQGVESQRAHRVVSRLLYIVEENATEMAARARERNPRIKDGGVTHELMFISKEVAEKRGLRYWKTPESAWQSITNLLTGATSGMSVWVANLLEATMDEIDGLRYDAPGSLAQEPAVAPAAEANGKDKAVTPISLKDAESLVMEQLSDEWTTRGALHDLLVPSHMTNSRFEDALSSLAKSGRIDREKERKIRPKTILRISTGKAKQPVKTKRKQPTRRPPIQRAKSAVTQEQARGILLDGLSEDGWASRKDLLAYANKRGVGDRSFERVLGSLVKEGLVERKKLKTGRTEYRLPEGATVTPEPTRSLLQAIAGDTIADRYANVMLSSLEQWLAAGGQDWREVEPILKRLDKLAGINPGE